MSASNRAKLIGKLHTSLKKHYTVPPAQPTRPLLEHILYASLLEDCPADLADEALAKCEQEFFDWNEVRVTTVTELSQVFSRLPDPHKAAARLKGNLQSIFEEFYTFELDHLKKENLGKAVAKFEEMPGMTQFVLNYAIQHGLGGHAIPVDYSAMVVMRVLGIASQSEAASGRVPGLERAVPKSKGIEFASLLHQAAVALNQNPKDKTGRAMLEGVAKGSSKQLDEWLKNRDDAKKRAARRKADAKAAMEQPEEPVAGSVSPKSPPKGKTEVSAGSGKSNQSKPAAAAGTQPKPKKKTAKRSGEAAGAKRTTKASTKAGGASKISGGKKSAKGDGASGKKSKSAKASGGTDQPGSTKKPKKSTTKSGSGKKASGKKSSSRKLAKRKPR